VSWWKCISYHNTVASSSHHAWFEVIQFVGPTIQKQSFSKKHLRKSRTLCGFLHLMQRFAGPVMQWMIECENRIIFRVLLALVFRLIKTAGYCMNITRFPPFSHSSHKGALKAMKWILNINFKILPPAFSQSSRTAFSSVISCIYGIIYQVITFDSKITAWKSYRLVYSILA